MYNGERYLAESIASVLAQTHQPLEVIVVDDGSGDATADVARRFGPPVQHVWQEHSEAGGAARARNRGVELSTGELVAFIDADDVWLPDKLQRQIAGLENEPRPDMVFGYARQFISPDLDDDDKRRIDCPDTPMLALVPSGLLVTRDAFTRVGPFQTNWRVGEFVDWYLRAMEKRLRTVELPDVLILRRLHQTNMGVRLRDARGDYARIVKASLDRRRGRTVPPAAPTPDTVQ